MKKNTTIKENSLYSFDIFDTLVTRRVATPTGIFLIMQDILVNQRVVNRFVSENFCRIRQEAEDFARCKKKALKNITEVDIIEIYQVIQDSYHLSSEEIKILRDLEINVEILNLVPLQSNLNLVKKYLSDGKNVVLISDMYYKEKDLRFILGKIDAVFYNLKIYSSADYGVSKADGMLYEIVRKKENVSSNWHHYGDNEYSDIKKANEHGIITQHFPTEVFTAYEKKMLMKENNRFFQGIIGSAKLAKVNKTAISQDKYNFGASFAGPIFYNYVDWVISNALQMGFKTLYFIARDGYIPKIVADIIIENRKLPLKTKYLYGSRLVWKKPLDDNYEEIIDWMFEEYSDVNSQLLAYRLGVNSEEMLKMLETTSTNKRLKLNQRKKFAEKFKHNEKIKNSIMESNKEKVKLVLSYFSQEIDFSEKNIAFVDLNGSGRTQDCVSKFLNKISPCTIYTFYLTNTLLNQSNDSVKLSYWTTKKNFSNWVELLSRTIDGQTIGYKQNGDKIEPITEKGNGEMMLKWGINEYIEGIKNFALNMVMLENINNMSFTTLNLFGEYDKYIREDLDPETATVMGDIPFKSIGNEEKLSFAAPKIFPWKLILNFILCKSSQENSEFPTISTARSDKFTKKIKDFLEECPTLQKFLLNIYVHKRDKIAYIRILGIKISLKRLVWNRG